MKSCKTSIFRADKADDLGFVVLAICVNDDFAGFDDLVELLAHRAGIVDYHRVIGRHFRFAEKLDLLRNVVLVNRKITLVEIGNRAIITVNDADIEIDEFGVDGDDAVILFRCRFGRFGGRRRRFDLRRGLRVRIEKTKTCRKQDKAENNRQN